jgi:hypothetical protein
LNFDGIFATRTTYDLLALAGDIGGLNEVMGWIGVLLVSWYTDKNSSGILTNLLFQQQKTEYKNIRTKQFLNERNQDQHKKICKHISTNYVLREPIPLYNLWEHCKNLCYRSKHYRRFQKIQKHAQE